MDPNLEILISGNENNYMPALEQFIDNATKTLTFPDLNQSNRQKLWNTLYNLASTSKDNNCIEKCLSAIRILSRDKTDLPELVSDEWMTLILNLTLLQEDKDFDGTPETLSVAVEAQKCLCNIIFNCLVAAVKSYKSGILDNIINRTKKYKNSEFPNIIKFFDMKLLFLISARCCETRIKLKNDLNAVQCLNEILNYTIDENVKNREITMDIPLPFFLDEDIDLMCEILKTLFNLTLHSRKGDEKELETCATMAEICRKLIIARGSSQEKTNMLHENCINLMTNMPEASYKKLIIPVPETQNCGLLKKVDFDMAVMAEALALLKHKFNSAVTVSNQQEILSPLLLFLLNSAKHVRAFRKYLKRNILPPLKDVHHRPEEGNTIRNHLCRLLTSPIISIRDLSAEFIFVLCKKNVSRMIKYTGYGNAAGMFAQRGLLGGQHDEDGEAEFSSENEDSDTEEYKEYKHGINQVLGCYEAPHPSPMANMSEEQKEAEAMKLVELIDSMTKCGTIKPCTIGVDGRPEPIEHVLQLQQGMKIPSRQYDSDSE